MRETFANLMGALAASVVAAGVLLGSSYMLAPSEYRYAIGNTAWLVVPIAVLIALLSLLPINFALQRIGRFRIRTAIVAGLIVGLAVVGLVAAVNFSFSGLADLALLFGGAGGLAGLAYYLVYVALSPNYSFKPTPLRGAA